jgi:hypothetical protein
MAPAQTEDVETLLVRERRAMLPFARQLILYLNPFALFKNAAGGPVPAQERARSYNQAIRWILIPYIHRWIVIAAAMFAAIIPAEALASEISFFIVPAAAFAVGSCIAAVVTASTVVAYVLLGTK